MDPDTPDNDAPETAPSKSAKKREMEALRKLGESLVPLGDRELEQMSLPEELLEAIQVARGIKARAGLKRQLQYIGKLLRGIDVAPVRAAMEARQQHGRLASQRFHELEELRDRLVEDGDKAIPEALDRFPAADRQRLRQLVRQCQKKPTDKAAPKAARNLFRYLRELQDTESD